MPNHTGINGKTGYRQTVEALRKASSELYLKLPRICGLSPNPIELRRFNFETDIDEDFRWYDCILYDQCLNVAAAGNWESFTCRDCPISKKKCHPKRPHLSH